MADTQSGDADRTRLADTPGLTDRRRTGSPFGPVGEAGSTTRYAWVYDQLLRTEGHWTRQVQNQQTRVTTTLTVNGFILAFVAGSGLLTRLPVQGWPAELLAASLCLLVLGLLAGLVALWPRHPIAGDETHFLSDTWFRAHLDDEFPAPILKDLVGTIGIDGLRGTLVFRRSMLFVQLVCLGLAAVTLAVALTDIVLR